MTIRWEDYKWIFMGDCFHADVRAWCRKHEMTTRELGQILNLSDRYFYPETTGDYSPIERNFLALCNYCDLNPLDYYGIERL